VTGTHTDGGWVKLDDTNLPGRYRLDLPDGVCAANVRHAKVMITYATEGLGEIDIDLVGYDPTAANLAANVTQISGDQTAADNAELFFDGSGYGVHLRRGTVNSVTSNTEWDITNPPGNTQGFKDCRILLHKSNNKYLGYVTNINGAGMFTVVWSNTTPTVAEGDVVEIFPPDTAERLESSILSITAKLPSKSRLAGTNNSDGDIQLDEATGNAAANVVQISGDATAADNAESFFDGTGYGPILLQSGINGNPTSGDTVIELASINAAQSDGAYNGCLVILSSNDDGENGGVARNDYDSGNGTLTINASPDFNLDAVGVVTILSPGFAALDRSAAANAATDIETLLNYFNGAPTFGEAMDDHGYGSHKAVGIVSAYDGDTTTVTLESDPGIFTMGATDQVDVIAIGPAP
jgi:hypothetical protein